MQYIACFLEKLCFNIVPATLSQIAIFIEFNDIYNAHNSALFKHFTSKTTIDFKYWTNSFHKTDCTANNNISHYINCKRIHEFLHGAFNDVGTHESIKDLLNYWDTQCIVIDYSSPSGYELLACVLFFFTINVTSTGIFVQYIVTW